MSTFVQEALIVFGLILLNGVFAMSEIAVVSASKARLRHRAERGHRGAQVALGLVQHPNRFLATVQVGITLVGILAGAYGGARLSRPLAAWLEAVPALAPYSDQIALTAVVLVITYFSLVIGELVPKQLGLYSPERIASAVARPMQGIATVTAPLVTLLSGSTNLMLKLFRLKASDEPTITEQEISLLIAEGARAGIIKPAEQRMVKRVFRFSDQEVGAVMTPRHEIVYLDLDDPSAERQQTLLSHTHSHLVVCRGGLDQALGIVDVKDLLAQVLAGNPLNLEEALRDALFVPESAPALRVLSRFRQAQEPLALVVDEYGGVTGLVSPNNLLEAIVGDLVGLSDDGEPDIVPLDDGGWLIDGMTPVDEVKDRLELRQLPEEDTAVYRTLGGLVLTVLGAIPETGAAFTWDRYRFEVVAMDGNRVDRVRITETDVDAAAT